ncbi:hypothetical protein [Porphyromonas gingivalis]|nr:hypothetical protein [Porphyromonas gingivalis]
MKRINIIIGFLFIYFVVMSVLGYPRERVQDARASPARYGTVCPIR